VRLRQGLADLGYNVSDGTEQIIALEAGSEPDTLILRKALERHGIYGAVFCAPATPKNRSLVRLTLNAGLREDECARVLAACAAIRDETGMARWPSTRRLRKLALV
jgi:CAI-1 autoinducer synthase